MNPFIQTSKNILLTNNKGGFTIPTPKLYPFQWNWDSGFTALGLAHFDIQLAKRELRTLFSGQWANGMIPHILFHSEKETTYFPNHPFWETVRNGGAPQKPKTSGITQPPVHGFILERICELQPNDPEVTAFAKELFPKIVRSHRFFYEYRDPHKEGLVFIFHPWESGRDNSPLWDDVLQSITVDKSQLPPYERQDNKISDPSERPTDADYDRYVYLMELGKRYAWDGPGIADESPFLIQDDLINAVLIRSNESLIRLGKELGMETGELEAWQTKSTKRFREKLWNASLGTFVSYDLRNETQIAMWEIGGMTALYAGIPTQEQAGRMHDYLTSLSARGFSLCPSFDPDHPRYDSKRYWKGPIWPQMNWLVCRGLQRYGFEETAEVVRNDLIDLVSRLGFHEYFEPEKEKSAGLTQGYGGGNFSWTAAAVLDLVMS